MLTLKNGRGKYLNKIIFFDDNGIIFVNDGILNGKAETTNKNNQKYLFETDLKDFEIFEPIKKMKVNTELKQNFYVASVDYMGNPAYDLYIYCNNKEGNTPIIERLADRIWTPKEGENHIYLVYKLTNICGNISKVKPANGDETHTFFIGQDLYTTEQQQIQEFIIEKFDHIERTEKAEKINELEHILYNDFKILGIKQAKAICELLKKYKNYID